MSNITERQLTDTIICLDATANYWWQNAGSMYNAAREDLKDIIKPLQEY